jgi:hypothetical protein
LRFINRPRSVGKEKPNKKGMRRMHEKFADFSRGEISRKGGLDYGKNCCIIIYN